MDRETANYIVKHFSNLMTDGEKLALRHSIYTDKTQNNQKRKDVFIERGLIRVEPEVLDFLKDGYYEFELNIAKRIMTEMPERVFLNYCPICGKLARTPYARQCRFCRHNWHDLTVAQFELNSSFQLTGRHFFLLGRTTKGEIKQGQFIDLTMVGLSKKPKIEVIEFALKRLDGRVWEDIALGVNGLSEEDKAHLKSMGAFGTPFDIVNKR